MELSKLFNDCLVANCAAMTVVHEMYVCPIEEARNMLSTGYWDSVITVAEQVSDRLDALDVDAIAIEFTDKSYLIVKSELKDVE